MIQFETSQDYITFLTAILNQTAKQIEELAPNLDQELVKHALTIYKNNIIIETLQKDLGVVVLTGRCGKLNGDGIPTATIPKNTSKSLST